MKSRAQEIFEEACELDQQKRAQYVRQSCGNDDELRADVESLLAAFEGAGQFMAAPTADCIAPTEIVASISEEPGKVIGRYKLLECIGEGGFGVVYMAQQSVPIRRRVALKIIKLGMDTKQVVARFEAERQALAMMDHPNIARVIDGGATDTGRPYFVMELVRGDPITEHCDRERLTTRRRLGLFQQVCQAVQHAHQKGIIHRDIKPSNVLVTIADGKPLVKVIDFGIAKATNSELTEKTLFTEFRQLIGTPQYMSPEQAERSGVDVDTRTDIYSLGVLLYEILTGCTPLDPKKLSSVAWHEMQRVICEEEPTKPSVLVSSVNVDATDIAKRRSTEPARLGGVLKGDLDWIVLRSLEKDRSRRYATASQLADDIDRYLRDEAVEATPPSTIYRLSKFARRNKPLLAAATAIAMVLLLGLIATSATAVFAIRARQTTMRALDQAELAHHQTREAAERARRSAIIAGAPLLLREEEAHAMADAWKKDLAKQRSERPSDDKRLAQEEAQFATWYGRFLLQRSKAPEAINLVAEYFERIKRVLGRGNTSFLALCNLNAQAHLQLGSPVQILAPIYQDLIPSMEQIHGPASATILLPEFGSVLARAGQDEQAAEAIELYLERRGSVGVPPTVPEMAKLDLVLDELVDWGEGHPEVYQRLKAFRETGITSSEATGGDKDPVLARDAETLQGTWQWKRYEKGQVVEHMVTQYTGNRGTTKWLDNEGNVLRGRSGTFKLSRSGAVKVITFHLGSSPQNGVASIYRLDKNRFITVTGLLVNHPGQPGPPTRIWHRVAANKETEVDNAASGQR